MIFLEYGKEVLAEFLSNPRDKSGFKAFFDLCYKYAISFLCYLKAKGYRFPIGQNSDSKSMSDLAIDILGSFLRSEDNKPFCVIFDFYNNNGFVAFKKDHAEELFDQFRSLLFGFIRQELNRINNESDPQIGNLKRRIKDILNSPDFCCTSDEKDGIEYVYCKNTTIKNRASQSLLTFERLLDLVEIAYNSSHNRREWCRNIFLQLDEMMDVQSRLKKHELISAMINVNKKYTELEGFHTYRGPSAEYQIQIKAIEIAKEKAISRLKNDSLLEFVNKGRIDRITADRFSSAVDRYLTDLIYSEDIDLIPVYFREVMPESEHHRYLRDYKYIFETIIGRAEEYFREYAKKSTKSGFGGYFKGR